MLVKLQEGSFKLNSEIELSRELLLDESSDTFRVSITTVNVSDKERETIKALIQAVLLEKGSSFHDDEDEQGWDNFIESVTILTETLNIKMYTVEIHHYKYKNDEECIEFESSIYNTTFSYRRRKNAKGKTTKRGRKATNKNISN